MAVELWWQEVPETVGVSANTVLVWTWIALILTANLTSTEENSTLKCVGACKRAMFCIDSVCDFYLFIFVFWLHLAKTWLWENLETLLPAHLVSLHNALIRPSGSDDNNNLSHLHDSVSPLNLSPLHALLSLSSTSPHLFRPPCFLSPPVFK